MPQLNKEQQLAVMHRDGPMLVLAGPGSGKTAVLVNRVLHLVKDEHIDPHNILVLTFSRLAAGEMRSRFTELADASYPVTFGTFHAIFYHILKRQGLYRTTEILTHKKKLTLLGITARRLRLKCCDDPEKLERLIVNISLMKMSCNSLLDELNEEEAEELKLVYEPYTNLCRSEGCIDFDDMINECLKALKGNDKILLRWRERYRYILVDEFQDIDSRQYEVLRLLAGDTRNVFCVGDDDQSIYSFRGAQPAVMRRFVEDYPDAARVELKVNYRCPAEVIRHAGKLISNNKDRFVKEQVCSGTLEVINEGVCLNMPDDMEASRRGQVSDGLGPHTLKGKDPMQVIEYKCFRTPADEAAYCLEVINSIIRKSGKDNNRTNPENKISTTVGILYRTSKSADLLEEKLRQNGIPYRRKDRAESFYTKEWVMDVASYIKLADAMRGDGRIPEDNKEDLFRILNRPERGLTRESITVNPLTREAVACYYEGDRDGLAKCNKLFDDIEFISGMNCYGAVNYILRGTGLGKYIRDKYFGNGRGSEAEEALERLKERARGYGTLRSWVEAIEGENDESCGVDGKYNATNYSMWDNTESASCTRNGISGKGHENCNGYHAVDIELMTIHGSKGLEFDNVIMTGLQEGVFPGKRCETASQLEEERRLFYVAMTRCRKRLWMLGIRRDEYGKRESRFIREAGFNSETVGSML